MPSLPSEGGSKELVETTLPLANRDRRRLGMLLSASSVMLLVLVLVGMVVERSAHEPLVRVGQPAPDFTLPSTNGSVVSLAQAGHRPVILVFVPSVRCNLCREQLQAIQAVLPDLQGRGALVFGVSTDTLASQRAATSQLGLRYPLLSEAPTVGQHPVGSAYGVYHYPEEHPGPVDANGIVVIDGAGIVRAVRVQPGRVMTEDDILAIVRTALDLPGGDR